MKIINCNNLFYQPIPITDKLILANGDSLYYNFIFTIFGGPVRLDRLGSMLYNILDECYLEDGQFDEDEDDYFDEDN